MTSASIVASHRTVTITRRPGIGYAIQVSACVHAISAGPRRNGQNTGTWTPAGHAPRRRVRSHRTIMAIEP